MKNDWPFSLKPLHTVWIYNIKCLLYLKVTIIFIKLKTAFQHLPFLDMKILHYIQTVIIRTYCEDIPMFIFHPGQKLCSIFSKLKSMA